MVPPPRRGGRRPGGGDGGDDDGRPAPSSEPTSIGQQTSHIANKRVRAERYAKLKHEKAKKKGADRRKRQREDAAAVAAGAPRPPRPEPKTIENQRVPDETVAAPGDAETAAAEAQDEFAAHFSRAASPHVLLTTCHKPSAIMFRFLAELLEVLPAATYYKRRGLPLKKVTAYAAKRGFTDLVVINEDRGIINGLLLAHLPAGPTAHFRLTNLVLPDAIKGHGRASRHRPELVLNNFDTALGRRLGRMLAALFPADPQFRGRRVVTFHNQRDFVFFRHHRYVFEEREASAAERRAARAAAAAAAAAGDGGDGAAAAAPPPPPAAVKARLQELGPRFTLRLKSLQAGVPAGGGGEFEWLRGKPTEGGRRKFAI